MTDYSIKFQNDLIKQIGLGINISKTYPKGHPSLQPVVQRLRILLKETPIEQESISLVIIEDIIMIEKERFDSKRLPIVKSLVQRFNQLGVKSITFGVHSSEEEIKEFFNAMAATPADLTDYGDILALIRAKGITTIQVNKFKVGVISTDEESQAMSWDQFLESITLAPTMSEEDKVKELGNFLTGIGLTGSESANVQTGKIVSGLEKLALLIADQYGEDRWDEYSMVFSRMLGVLSPSIKKNIVKYRTENKKLAVLFKSLIPTMSDEDLVDVISLKAKDKSPSVEQDVVDILKNVTGSRLPGILSTLRVNVPELDFEKIVARLMTELKTKKGEKVADKFISKNLETEMRYIFPSLRDKSQEVRIEAVNKLMEFADKIFESEKYDLIKLLVDRFDTMADAETELATFIKVIEAQKSLYKKSEKLKKDDLVRFISKKFGKHLLRKDASLLDRKKLIIKCITEIRDENYLQELVSLLWDPGTFAEARGALITMADVSAALLIQTLRDTEDRSVRMKIIDVLIRIGEKVIPNIEVLLNDDEWYVRRNGIYILGEIKVDKAIDKVGRLIDDEVEQVQLAVVECLHKIGGEKEKGYLLKALNGKHRNVILAAMEYLDKDDVVQKISELKPWLKSRKGIPDKKEEGFRGKVIEILGRFGDDSVIASLLGVLNEKPLFKGDLLKPTKFAALNALAKIGTKKAMEALHEATSHKDQFVASVARDIEARFGVRS
jgi:HEAT repeat protein